MSEYRILGKSVRVLVTRDGDIVSEITAIRNFTFQTGHRILTENYLGETSARHDEIFDEVTGSFTVNPEGPDILSLQELITNRSTERTADPEQVSATFRITFPTGVIRRISIPNLKFDPIPLNIGGRDAYVEMSFSFKSNGYLLTP